jgi:hypothetical protein
MLKKALNILFFTVFFLVACNTNNDSLSPTPLLVESELEQVETTVDTFIDSIPIPSVVTTPTLLPSSSYTTVFTDQSTPQITPMPQATKTVYPTSTATPVSWRGRLAFASQQDDTNGDGQISDGDSVNIFSFDIESKKLTQITSGDQRDIHPAWSPSGNEIAFVSNRNGNFDLFSVSVDGSTLQQLTDTPEDETTPSWSPDGTAIAYVQVTTLESGKQERRLFLTTVDNLSQELPVGPGNIFAPHWSPDGRYLLFQREDIVERDDLLRRVENTYFWDTVTSSLIKLDLEGTRFKDLFLQNPQWLPTQEYRISFSIQKRLSDVPTHQVKVYDLEWENDLPVLREMLTLNSAPEPYTWGPNGEWYVALTYNGFEGADRYDLISYPIEYTGRALIIDTYKLLINEDIIAEGVYYFSNLSWIP